MADNDAYDNEVAVEPNVGDSNGKEQKSGEDDAYEVPIEDPPYVEVIDVQPAFAGMPREVLLHYSRQRGYFWAREILTVIVFLTTFILLALVIAIIAISPPCLEFWQTSPIYQIYPKSFRSSNDSTGYGDVNGIIEKLDYLSDDLGVEVIAVNSVYESGNVENDYEISDFRNIDPAFGSMANMDTLIEEVHNKGMKLVIDFVPNQSSDKHKWFLASSNTSHADHQKYIDYYVWVEANDSSQIPNNWMSEDGSGSSWTWHPDRQAFYYHTFATSQPDLNIRNKDVRNELKNILRFWLEKGVDGFHSIGTSYMLEATHLRDNPLKNVNQTASKENTYPDYTKHYKGVHDFVAEWRTILEEYSTEAGVFRFLQTEEDGDLSTVLRYYGTEKAEEADFPMNNLMMNAGIDEWNAESMAQQILNWMNNIPEGKWPNWALSSRDKSRIASRAGSKIALCAAVMAMTLPGTPSIFYGDEIGMMDSASNGAVAPMQWTADNNAGFCSNCTAWIDVNADYMNGVTVQNETDDATSVLANYKSLISLRSGIVYQRGYLCMLGSVNGVLAYVRELSGLRSALILINFQNATSATLDLATVNPSLPSNGRVEYFSGSDDTLNAGNSLDFNDIRLPPYTGIAISYEPGGLLNEVESMEGKCFINLRICYNPGLQITQYC